MTSDTCRHPTCSNATRKRGERYGDNNEYAVSTYGARYCSSKCELTHEHAKADARDARRGAVDE
jgi:hypothetical protein